MQKKRLLQAIEILFTRQKLFCSKKKEMINIDMMN